ncbi:MAG TPA: DUF2071 domain-containing protein, partial [Verrucomicrobiae bacterium]
LLRPIATHDFLNVRTYVRHDGESGIHFMTEWLSSQLAVHLGPRSFGLPYRLGQIQFHHDLEAALIRGRVRDARTGGVFAYHAEFAHCSTVGPCPQGSLDEWLMERYTAFTHRHGSSRFFRVWHESWPQMPVVAEITEMSLVTKNWPPLRGARLIGANFSPGVRDVWMGWPHRLRELCASESVFAR